MPLVRARATVAAAPQTVWDLVSDPASLPRWWPGVTRVEAISREGFTQVMLTKQGRAMRLDFEVTASREPELRAWTLLAPGTPFERVVAHWETTVSIEPGAAGRSQVTIEEEQQMRGTLRLAGVLQRRAAKRRLRGALNGLGALYDGDDAPAL